MAALTPRPPSEPRRVGVGFFVVAVGAVAVGLLAPLLICSFTRQQLLILVPIEACCLIAVSLAAVLVARRLRASHEDLWGLSRRDELTGVGNYRALHERLSEEVAAHSRPGREFALILIDLDRFKEVNDEYGHLHGDRVLAAIGLSLREEVRGKDAVFRQGGDEFAVIAPDTNGEEAEAVAERLRVRVRASQSEGASVTAGTGFAIFPGDGRTPDELLRAADSDLFGAKRAAPRA
jgi:diguanylate cyclase (GGDEF)-like protein